MESFRVTRAFMGPISLATSPRNVAVSVVIVTSDAGGGAGPKVGEAALAQVDRVSSLVREVDRDRSPDPLEFLRRGRVVVRVPVEPVDERGEGLFDGHGPYRSSVTVGLPSLTLLIVAQEARSHGGCSAWVASQSRTNSTVSESEG